MHRVRHPVLVSRPFTTPAAGWPLRFREDPKFWGPNRDDDCPCGSHRSARSCHSDRSGEWHLPPMQSLLSDGRTGFSHPRCYATHSNDCSDKISKEHWLSRDIIEAVAGSASVNM